MRFVPFVGLVLALVAAAGGSGAGSPQAPADVEREARAIDGLLVAPCCFSQPVAIHQSPAADEVRRDVRARLAAGQTRQQILDAYVAEHGKRILAVPPPKGFDVTLYALPLLVFVASAAAAVAAIRKFSSRSKPVRDEPVPAGAGSPADESRLDDELRDMD